MLSLPALLGFLVSLPAIRRDDPPEQNQRRRRAVQALGLSPHLLDDVGMRDYQGPADDPRWARRIDLER